jgi:hypothetical protein
VCRAAQHAICDVEEKCDGNSYVVFVFLTWTVEIDFVLLKNNLTFLFLCSADCPSNKYAPDGTVCKAKQSPVPSSSSNCNVHIHI